MKKHFLTLSILFCAAFCAASLGFAQQLSESAPGTVDLAAPRVSETPDAASNAAIGARELSLEEIDRRRTYLEYAAHEDAYSTAHLKPYTGFRFSLPLNSLGLGVSTNSPISIKDYFSPNSDWKDNGYLVIDFARIAKETDGVGLDIALRANIAFFEFGGQAKRTEKSGGVISYSYKQWQKDYKEDKKHPLIAEQSQFTTPKPSKDPNYVYSDWGWNASLLNLDMNMNIGLSNEVIGFLGNGNGDSREFPAGVELSAAVFLETLSFTMHKEHVGIIDRRGGGVEIPILKNMYISVGISHYEPILYIPPSALNIVVDVNDNENKGDMVVYAKGTVKAYSAMNPYDIQGGSYFGGIDLNLNAEYNFKGIGMSFLDVGTTITHLPLIPAVVTTAIEKDVYDPLMTINAGNAINGGEAVQDDTADFIKDLMSEDALKTDVKKTILRPFRWDFYALFRPLQMLHILPKNPDFLVARGNIGFTALFPAEKMPSEDDIKGLRGNDFYSFNWGVGADLNVGRWFTFSFYTGSYDGLIHNTIGLDFHWYVLPVFLIVDCSAVDNNKPSDYANAWSITGATVKIGAHWAF